jgi:predicted membrane-bound spermidine synthase
MRGGGSLLASVLAGKGPVAWYAGALAWQTLAILPACTAMGATIPLAMLAISKERLPGERTSFSFLYFANVLGGVVGALLPTFVIIELLGFKRTLLIATVINATIATFALFLARRTGTTTGSGDGSS